MKRRFETTVRITGYGSPVNTPINTYISRGLLKASWLDIDDRVGSTVADVFGQRIKEAGLIRKRALKEEKAQQEEVERQARSLSGRWKALRARMRLY